MILIGTDEGIYRWLEGSGWPVYHGLQDRAIVGLASPGAGVLVAVDRGGTILESTNNGIDWQVIPVPAGAGLPTALAVQGTPPVVVLAVRPMAVYRRAIGTPVPRAPVSTPIGSGRTAALAGHARRLADGATALLERARTGKPRAEADPEAVRLAGWTPLNTPHVPRTKDGPEVRALAASPGPGGPWFAAVGGAGLWRTDDSGHTWAQCPGLPSEVYSVRGVPGKPGDFWAATADGAWFSGDGGRSWEARSAGLDAVRRVRAVAIKPGAPGVLLAGASPAPTGGASPTDGLGHGLYESTDGGKSWAKVVKRNFPEDLDYDTIADVQFDPADPDNIVAALGSGELWSTNNGGAYWGPLARQIRAARVLCAVR
jgi:hypothetical protein